jgi:hypothetical protein
MNVEFALQTADTTLSRRVSLNLLWDHAGKIPSRSGAPEKFRAASGAVFRILLNAQDPPSLDSLFFFFHYRSNITNTNTLSAMDFSTSRPTKRFGLLKKQKDESVEGSLASVKMPSSSMFRIMVNFVKEGPTASENYKMTDRLLDEETEAPMPRRKTQYEIFLKHKVREAQVSTNTSVATMAKILTSYSR